jgi:transposase InsO family protein
MSGCTPAPGFLTRAVAWFAGHDVTVARVLTDNAKTYRIGNAWITACAQLNIGRRFTKPGRPATFGKAERLNRTLRTEWAYATLDQQRRAHRRPGHLADSLQHCPQPLRPQRSPADQPTRRVNNLSGHDS